MSGTNPRLPRYGWELFYWCYHELAPRSRLSAAAHRAVLTDLQSFYGASSHREDRSTPPRARRNRASVKAALCSLECIAIKHLQRGRLLAIHRALGPTALSTASRYAAPASRSSPLSFSGDKRDHQQQDIKKITANLQPDGQVRVLCDLALVANSGECQVRSSPNHQCTPDFASCSIHGSDF